jgi:hypothetical protein
MFLRKGDYMSIRLMSQVWDHSSLEGTSLLMLLAIADHANDDGVCWPSVRRLAQRVRVSVRQAQRLLRSLEAEGHIAVNRGCGRGKCSVITVKGGAGVDTLRAENGPELAGSRVWHDTGAELSRGKGDIGVTSSLGKFDALRASPNREGDISDALLGKGDIRDTLSENGDVDVTLSRENGEMDVIFPNREKATPLSSFGREKVTSGAQRVTSSAQKGDMLSHAREEPSIEPSLTTTATTITSSPDGEACTSINPVKEDLSSSRFGDLVARDDSSESRKIVEIIQAAREQRKHLAQPRPVPEQPPHAPPLPAQPPHSPPVQEQPQARSAHQSFFDAVCWVVGWDAERLTKEQKGQVAQTLGVLAKAGYQVEEVRRFWREVWHKDWRWVRNRARPTLSQLRAEIGRLHVDERGLVGNGNGTNQRTLIPEDEELRRLLREARRRERPSPPVPASEGVQLSPLQGHALRLPGRADERPAFWQGAPVPVPAGDQ